MKDKIIRAMEFTVKYLKLPLPKLGKPFKDKTKYTRKEKHKNIVED